MTSRRALLACTAALFAAAADARPIHYGSVDNADLAACDALEWRGRTEAADRCFRALLDSDAPAAVRADAAWALSDLHAANRLFQAADRATPDNADILARWGDLYADTHQDAEAMNLYRDALAVDSQHPFALLGAASVLVGGFSDAANAYLEPLLTNASLHPGARAGAWLLLARIALENHDYDEVREHLDTAAALIDGNDWPPLEVYALRAALDLAEGAADSVWFDRALDYNPAWGAVYATAAHFRVITRRYRDAIDLYQQAVDVQPDLADAHENMGVNLLRDNQVTRARRHLETAHDLDPFSPVAVNTLRLLDSFEHFPVIRDPATPDADDALPIVLRLHEDEADAIAPYAIDLTRRAIDEFAARYEYDLSEPVVIEMYPDHEDFAVRTAGMPGIGILGATFGYVVAMDSPSSRSPNDFQWGTTLWHELAHVFTLEASDHLVPRWFSEGVSVYEEWRSGPTPGVRIPMDIYAAMRDDKFLPVAILDQGFMRPTYENQVIVSYMQAGLICRFIDEHYGEGRLAALLRAFAAGEDTAVAIRSVLDIAAPALDREFNTWLAAEFGHVLDILDEWHEEQAEAMEAAAAEDWQRLIEAANGMLTLLPDYAEPDSPWLMLAHAYRQLGDTDAEQNALATFHEHGGFEPESLMRYAGMLAGDGRTAEAIHVLGTVVMVQPLEIELHEELGRLLLDTGDAAGALREFEIVLARDAHDKANAYFQLARAHRALGNDEATRDNLLSALDIAPGYRDAQKLLLELMRGDP